MNYSAASQAQDFHLKRGGSSEASAWSPGNQSEVGAATTTTVCSAQVCLIISGFCTFSYFRLLMVMKR